MTKERTEKDAADLAAFVGQAGIQLIRYDGELLSIRSWVVEPEFAEELAESLSDPSGEYLAPATRDGYEKRLEL